MRLGYSFIRLALFFGRITSISWSGLHIPKAGLSCFQSVMVFHLFVYFWEGESTRRCGYWVWLVCACSTFCLMKSRLRWDQAGGLFDWVRIKSHLRTFPPPPPQWRAVHTHVRLLIVVMMMMHLIHIHPSVWEGERKEGGNVYLAEMLLSMSSFLPIYHSFSTFGHCIPSWTSSPTATYILTFPRWFPLIDWLIDW